MSEFAEIVEKAGAVPLGWAGSTEKMDYLNFGDALSPVMVALCSGLPVERIPFASKTPRLAAVGTIGHGFSGGKVWFWGTGCSPWLNPGKAGVEKTPYVPPKDTTIDIRATRGRVSEQLLSGGKGGPGVYGDPVWLLPRFYDPGLEKKYELGVILHLSELTDRELDVHFNEQFQRYLVPDELAGKIRLINTVTRIGVDPMREKLDEILSCKRLVSTSLHGMVFAESYRIPCLYFAPHSQRNGVRIGVDEAESTLSNDLDPRVADLYSGLGKARFPVYVQPRTRRTDWEALIAAIDSTWSPVSLDGDALLAALPIKPNPVAAPPGGTVFDLPLIRGLALQHDVKSLRQADALRHKP